MGDSCLAASTVGCFPNGYLVNAVTRMGQPRDAEGRNPGQRQPQR